MRSLTSSVPMGSLTSTSTWGRPCSSSTLPSTTCSLAPRPAPQATPLHAWASSVSLGPCDPWKGASAGAVVSTLGAGWFQGSGGGLSRLARQGCEPGGAAFGQPVRAAGVHARRVQGARRATAWQSPMPAVLGVCCSFMTPWLQQGLAGCCGATRGLNGHGPGAAV